MKKEEIITAIKKVRDSKKRNFKQKFDLIITLRNLDLKKPENQIELFIPLHFSKGKKVKICALVGPELITSAKGACDLAISVDDFDKYADKKVLKKLTQDYDFFIAQATIMPKVATTLGKVLGSKGKMPNPKAGCVVPPTANLKALTERLQKVVGISLKTSASIQAIVGNEEMPDEEIADNILTIYNTVVHALPAEKHNIKDSFIKLTMGKPVKIGTEEEISEQKAGKQRIKAKSKEKTEAAEEKEEQKTEKVVKKKAEIRKQSKEVKSAAGN